jgi:Met-zincin/Domain of unknown function (DUF5117)
MKPLVALLLLVLCSCAAATVTPSVSEGPGGVGGAQPTSTAPSAPQVPARDDVFLGLQWDETNGKLMMTIPRLGEEMIYVASLPAGVGSNPIGLDRGGINESQIVRFDRFGPRVLMVAPNYRFRALSNDPNERRAVEESFAQSVIWSFKVEKSGDDGVTVDATDFFLSDQNGVAARLRGMQQGGYSIDKNRSAIYMPRTKSFPRNTEVEAILTFETNERPGNLISGVTPVARFVTVRAHHSFVALPEPGYKPRRLDPRVGVSGIDFYDYASPFTGPLQQSWISRHRLEKKDPNAAVSEPIKPIIYYVDNGAPEPIRSALVEGASWWAQAFEAAGFKNAFIVKVLPDGADPMDIRYNMINWVHRSTRGWSYGGAVVDPRTGEIVKGNVLLGSLRIRQDVMLGRGLIPQYDELRDEALSQLDPKTSPSIMALQRIRQLSAHEVGHTLGLDHNMAASSSSRASVMDYPAPYVKIVGGKLDLSDAYTNGVGAYDKFAIRYAYAQFPPNANEDAELNRIAREGLLFIKDQDARAIGGAHPLGSVWDSPGDPIAMLKHEIEVRRIALSQFGLRNVGVGTPLSSLEEMLVPLYLHHRYQLEAAAKSIGGIDYTYAVKENGAISPQPVRKIVAPERQLEAIAAVVSTLDSAFLQLPPRIIELIPPRAFGSEGGTAELFEHRTAPAFDPISAAAASADITLAALLDPRRAARLYQFKAENAANPGFNELLDEVFDVVTRREMGYRGAITRAVARLTATRLMELAANRDADAQVRAEASEGLRRLNGRLGDAGIHDAAELAHRHAMRDDIERFLARPDQPRTQPKPPEVPPGPPIGG